MKLRSKFMQSHKIAFCVWPLLSNLHRSQLPIRRWRCSSSSSFGGPRSMSSATSAITNVPLIDRVKDKSLVRGQAFINGEFVDGPATGTVAITDPGSGAWLGTVPDMGEDGAISAISAAKEAFLRWRAVPAKERGLALRRWYDLIVSNTDDLAVIMTSECGKTLSEARGEIAYAASFVEFYSEEAKRIEGGILPGPSAAKRVLVMKQPVGVCALITPWNFPSAMITRKAAPALAAGCTVVVKPAEATPFSAIALAELARRAGIPPGVLNIVTASRANAPRVGDVLASHPAVGKLSFTGSTAVGKALAARAAGTVKRVSLELGGNAPFIVFDDADLSAAVDGAMASKFRNAGQTCVCANRFLVQGGVHDEFVRRLAARVEALRVGHGLEPGVTCGPLINAAAVAKVQRQLDDAVARGGRVVARAGGGGGGAPAPAGGGFVAPALVVGAGPEMECFREETFGPLAPVARFETEAEALALANDTRAGLAGYVYTRDLGRAFRMAEGLEYGMVGVNEGVISSEVAPFGGVKESGLGREGSRYGTEEYLEVKYVCLGLGQAP